MNVIVIYKVIGKKPSTPDYIMEDYNGLWILKVYPEYLISYDNRDTITHVAEHEVYLPPNTRKPLYDLLDCKGSPTMAMLYKDVLPGTHYHYQDKDFLYLSPERMVERLVHWMIYEPGKIYWDVDWIGKFTEGKNFHFVKI